jgi:hypothetical protein
MTYGFEIATTLSFFVSVLIGFADVALALFTSSTFGTSSIPLRSGVVGVATSATFMFFAEAWRGVAVDFAVAFVLFAVSAMFSLLFAGFTATLWRVILRLTNGFVISK